MIRGREEFNIMIELMDLNIDKLGRITVQINDSKFENGHVDITACLLNRKKKVIEYVDIYENLPVNTALAKADQVHELLAGDEEFSTFYSNVIENNYTV